MAAPTDATYDAFLRAIAVDLWSGRDAKKFVPCHQLADYATPPESRYEQCRNKENDAWLWERLMATCADKSSGLAYSAARSGVTVDLQRFIEHLRAAGLWPEHIRFELREAKPPWERKRAVNKLYDDGTAPPELP
jgi:hypothetical protein